MLKNIFFILLFLAFLLLVYYFFKNDSRIRCFYFSCLYRNKKKNCKIYFTVNLNAYRIFNQSIILFLCLCTNLNLLVFTLYGLFEFLVIEKLNNSLPIILFLFLLHSTQSTTLIIKIKIYLNIKVSTAEKWNDDPFAMKSE